MQKRKLQWTEVESPVPQLVSPSPGLRSRSKRQRQALSSQFDNGDYEEHPLMDLLNLKLSATSHKAVTLRCDDLGIEHSYVGAFVYYCPSSQTDHVWRSIIVAQSFQRRMGSIVHMRACPKPMKRIREEDLQDEEFMRSLEKLGGFGSPQLLDSCVVVPVTCDSPSNLLFRGSAILSALGLVNEPLYFREGWLPWEGFCDQDAHKRDANLKVEKTNGEVGLYELHGIRWKRILFE